MKIKDFMKKICVVDSDINLKKVAEIMVKKNIGSLVYYKNNEVRGLVTDRDILKNVKKLDKKISEITKNNIITIDLHSDLDEAATIMAKHKIKRLPVMENGKLVGIISMTDLVHNLDTIKEDARFS